MALRRHDTTLAALLRALRFGPMAMLLLMLGACSSTTFIYNRLDFILPWYLDDYVELNREQRASLDDFLTPFLRWHRVDELPRYIEIVGNIEKGLDETITSEVVGQTFSKIEQAWLRLEDEALGWLLKLGEDLSDGQIAAFLAVLQEQQLEYEEDYLDRGDAEYLDDSYENFEDGLQDYLGRLDENQRAILREAVAELRRIDRFWLKERAAWLVNLDRLLERGPGWQQNLRDLKAARADNYSTGYSETYAHNLTVIQRAIAAVINARSEKQDRRLRKKLRNLKEDFETLTAQGESSRQASV